MTERKYSEHQLIPDLAPRIEVKESVKDVLSSAFGSACCVYAGQPFDTIKVRVQLKAGEKIEIFNVLKNTVRNGGVFSLWRGSVPALTGQLLENSVAFSVNGALKRWFKEETMHKNEISYAKPIMMGGVTGFFSALVLCPCDVIKCRAQANIERGHGSVNISDISKNIIRNHGIGGLWKGVGAQILRDIPFNAAFFGSYDILCNVFKQHTKWSEPTIYFISGGVAGQIGWVCSIIPDTIKSQIQVSEERLTISNTFKEIVKNRGFRGLFTGIEVALIRAFPANAALFLGYEYFRKFLDTSMK